MNTLNCKIRIQHHRNDIIVKSTLSLILDRQSESTSSATYNQYEPTILLRSIILNLSHVLSSLMPVTTIRNYNLRLRQQNFVLLYLNRTFQLYLVTCITRHQITVIL